MELYGRRVLITGASRGIGESLAEAFAAAGALLALVARTQEALDDLVSRLGGTAHRADLADPDELEGLIGRIEADAGPVDVLVNNAGLYLPGALAHQDPEDLRREIALNLTAPVELCRQVLPGMLQRGSGHIVNISSLAGAAGFPGMASYCATKAGLTHFSAILRAELKGLPVGVTVVELGPILTEMLEVAKSYGPTAEGYRRLARLQLLPPVQRESVAAATVAAVRRGRRHVRLPRRAALVPMLSEAPRRLTEILLAGIRAN